MGGTRYRDGDRLLALGLAGGAWMRARHPTPWSWAAEDRAKVVEAQVAVTEIAWGVALCAERARTLPPASAKVPALPAVARMVYQSKLEDWNDEAFACAGFHMHRPQHFQYQWIPGASDGGDEGGLVQADADFDGDLVVDHTVRLRVRCKRVGAALHCLPDPMPTAPEGFGVTSEVD